MKCNVCGSEFEGKFCTNCGTPVGQVAKAKNPTNAPVMSSNRLHSYKVENVVIKARVFTDAQDLIPKKVQPLLDMGTKKAGSYILLPLLFPQRALTFVSFGRFNTGA